MSFDVVNYTTTAAIATNGTATLSYPTNRNAGHYSPVGHLARSRGLMNDLALNTGFTLTFNASDITFTYKGSTSIPAGTNIMVQLNRQGTDGDLARRSSPATPRAGTANVSRISLGAPATASANYLSVSAAVNSGVAAVLAATDMLTARIVVGAWTGTAIVTIVGKDEYGVAMTEVSASGTSHTGTKAFKTITSITPNANITGATFGTGVVLGLPIYVEGSGSILAEAMDGVAATAGTMVGGVTTTATNATGDVRGTYSPNSAPNAARKYVLVVNVDDPAFKGVPQA